jgi:hypothetical protein
MMRVLGIGLFVAILWFLAQNVVQVGSESVDTGSVAESVGSTPASIPQRAGRKVMEAHQQGEERIHKLLGE